jgi:uncharacterized protein YqjF (DUF2071 family)
MMENVANIQASCPFEIDSPVMRQRWERLTFLHWAYDQADVARLLPEGLEVEPYDGVAWVGLVPFFMVVATGHGRTAPWASRFCETNIRTYVRDRQGRSGIWFLSLDAARLGAVAVARTTYRLPYFWSGMDVSEDGHRISYRCRRRWPGPAGTRSQVSVEIGDRLGPTDLSERDHFLTARWVLFSVSGSRHRFARACHEPWPLHRAEAVSVSDGLVQAAGLPAPAGEPLVLYSPGVDVAIGRPEHS